MADKVDARLLTTTLQLAATNETVNNRLVAPQFPEAVHQRLSWARIKLAEAGLLEPVTTADYRITKKGRELADEQKEITLDYLRSLSQGLRSKPVARPFEDKSEPKVNTSIDDGHAALPLNLILYGPPGTGKTRKFTEEYFQRFTDGRGRRYEMITFHPSHSYEEFIEGLRPVIGPEDDRHHRQESEESKAKEDGTTKFVRYEVVPGVFKRICRRAAGDPDDRYALFIDEINRGNVPALFGELITLIEEDKRGLELTLPYSGDRFSVPPNLHIVGTMNTADRSIALLDVALRRRFEFEEIDIDYDALEQALGQVPELREQRLDVAEILRRMNERISYLFDRDHRIGHGWLIGIGSLAELREAFYYKIIPLLIEYFYDDWTKVCSVLGEHPEQARSTDLIEKRKLSAENLFGRGQGRSEDKWTYSVGNHQTWTAKHFAKIAGVPTGE